MWVLLSVYLIKVLGFFTVVFLFSVFLLYRYLVKKDNKDKIPEGNNVVAPISGKVLDIKIVDGSLYLDQDLVEKGKKYSLITFSQSFFKTRYNKIPFGGKVVGVSEEKHEFIFKDLFVSSIEYYLNIYDIKSEIGLIRILQTAGYLCRKPSSLILKSQYLEKGEKFGITKSGSKVLLLIPENGYNVLVKKGDQVSSGETVICSV